MAVREPARLCYSGELRARVHATGGASPEGVAPAHANKHRRKLRLWATWVPQEPDSGAGLGLPYRMHASGTASDRKYTRAFGWCVCGASPVLSWGPRARAPAACRHGRGPPPSGRRRTTFFLKALQTAAPDPGVARLHAVRHTLMYTPLHANWAARQNRPCISP